MTSPETPSRPDDGRFFDPVPTTIAPAHYMGGAAGLVGLGMGLRNYFATPRRVRRWTDILLPTATLGLGVGGLWAYMNARQRATEGLRRKEAPDEATGPQEAPGEAVRGREPRGRPSRGGRASVSSRSCVQAGGTEPTGQRRGDAPLVFPRAGTRQLRGEGGRRTRG